MNWRVVLLCVCFCGSTQGWLRHRGGISNRNNRIEDIKLRYYNGKTIGEYIDIPLSQATTLLETNSFQKNFSTVLYIHGFKETAQQESVNVIVSAFLDTKPDTNVVLLDWSNMIQGLYFLNAVPNTKTAGTAVAVEINKLLDNGLPLDKFHIIGYSLGSHVAGYIARELKNKFNKIVKRVTALDPAHQGFYPSLRMEHITASDAEFVDVIHTDAGGYGAPVSTGSVDFWLNGGRRVQPGCPWFAPIPLTANNLCSHMRSWRFFAESIRNPRAFPVSSIYMGLNVDTSARGNYYLTTNGQAPFGKGV